MIWAAGAPRRPRHARRRCASWTPYVALLEAFATTGPQGPGFLPHVVRGRRLRGRGAPALRRDRARLPLSPYGELKLAQERAAVDILAGVCPLVIGRFSNLYGPGPEPREAAGPHLAPGAVRGHAAADQHLRAARHHPRLHLRRRRGGRDHSAVERFGRQPHAAQDLVIASGQPVTVGQLIRTMNQVTKTRVPVALGTHPSAYAPVARPSAHPDGGIETTTPLPAGMKAGYLDILDRVQQSSLTG